MFYKKKLIGKDEFGNKYYQKNEKRFIEYSSDKNPTSISVYWYLWLHNSIDEKLKESPKNIQKAREINRTGTNLAYNPKKSVGNYKIKDYNSWKPENCE